MVDNITSSPPKSTPVIDPNYKQAIELFSINPIETINHKWGLACFVLISIFSGIFFEVYSSYWELSKGINPITVWELIALFDTFVFAIFFFYDLYKQTKDEEHFNNDFGLALMGVLWVICLFLIVISGYFLLNASSTEDSLERTKFFLIYQSTVFITFLIFAILDYAFAIKSRKYRKMRQYWTLLVFVDGPAATAFFLLLLYSLVASTNENSHAIISGATVMQMILANLLYLMIDSNWHNWLRTKLCVGVTSD
jgi:hypothetical protein